MSCSESVVIIVNNCKKSFFCDYILYSGSVRAVQGARLKFEYFRNARVRIPRLVFFLLECTTPVREEHSGKV
jgi:hypothetical protein